MKLFVGAWVTVAVGWAAVLASPAGDRSAPKRHANLRSRAEQACRARGPDCKLAVKAGAPRDPGAACVCG